MKNTRKNKKVPLHYYIIFYGVPFALSLLTIVLLVWHYRGGGKKVVRHQQEEVDLQFMMDQAQGVYEKQEKVYLQAMEFYKYKEWKSCREKLLDCRSLLEKAISEGKKTWDLQVKLIGQDKNKSVEQIEKFAYERYGGHKQRIQLWEESLRNIEQKLKELKGK